MSFFSRFGYDFQITPEDSPIAVLTSPNVYDKARLLHMIETPARQDYLEEEGEANDLEGVLFHSDALCKLFYKKLLKWICDEQEDLVARLKQQCEALHQAASFIVAYRAAA